MKKLVIIILFLLLLITCTENEPLDSEANEIKITGKVFSDEFSTILNDIEVDLSGEEVLKDTTDINGNYEFVVKFKGEYLIEILNEKYQKFDSTLFISNNTSLFINLILKDTTSTTLNDYFPISVGNWWSYSYDYRPISSEHFYHRQQGKLTWKIISIENDSKYLIEESVDGIEMNWDLNYDVDTTEIIKKQIIEFNSDENGAISTDANNYFENVLNIKLSRYFQSSLNFIDLKYRYDNWDVKDEGIKILNSLECGYKIKLGRDIGITEILIMNWSNGSPSGNFNLIDYEIN